LFCCARRLLLAGGLFRFCLPYANKLLGVLGITFSAAFGNCYQESMPSPSMVKRRQKGEGTLKKVVDKIKSQCLQRIKDNRLQRIRDSRRSLGSDGATVTALEISSIAPTSFGSSVDGEPSRATRSCTNEGDDEVWLRRRVSPLVARRTEVVADLSFSASILPSAQEF